MGSTLCLVYILVHTCLKAGTLDFYPAGTRAEATGFLALWPLGPSAAAPWGGSRSRALMPVAITPQTHMLSLPGGGCWVSTFNMLPGDSYGP